MKTNIITKFFAFVLCAALLLSFMPATAFAEENNEPVAMVEGDVKTDFAPEGAKCTSSDSSVAWVDEKGSLNALKPGTAEISVPSDEGEKEYTVNVSDYEDGTGIAGNLKIIARYNDSMQFYDGHVYLVFTSYQDGVELSVPDLYGNYIISNDYYKDINEDISNGSNHTGNDTEKYFKFDKDKKSVTLDRGEVVTIGMYRGFDLSVPQAALGSIKNSSGWNKIKNSGKAEIIKVIFDYLEKGKLSVDEAKEKLMQVFKEVGGDYTKFLDGVVDGGVCFNRELYNQKLEWDQYENVTYNMDITRMQLNIMTMYLRGNYGNFSLLKNSCATVALRAWNAAVGTRNGVDTAYKLNCTGEGIFALVDAPKSVRDSIRDRLQGCYLNNSQGVAEPGAGYQDDTGWVYVTVPKKVKPVTYTNENDNIKIDESKTKLSYLQNAARGAQPTAYTDDGGNVSVKINTEAQGELSGVNSVVFTNDGNTYTLNSESKLSNGVWFKVKVENPAEGEDYYARNAEGKIMPSSYSGGWVSFYSDSLPAKYKIVAASQSPKNLLETSVKGADKVSEATQIYSKNGDEKTDLNSFNEVEAGTKIYVKSGIGEYDTKSVLSGITINGNSALKSENYDKDEKAYVIEMPAGFVKLAVEYEEAEIKEKKNICIQAKAGDSLDVADYAELLIGSEKTPSDKLKWKIESDEENILEQESPSKLKALKEGSASVFACAENNENLKTGFLIEVYESTENMVKITFEESDDFELMSKSDDEEYERYIAFSGYLVKKGSVIKAYPGLNNQSSAISSVVCNGKKYGPDDKITADSNCNIKVETAEAYVDGMPERIILAKKGDTYQLNLSVKYKNSDAPVYDPSIRYESSDELVKVNENGLVTVAGDVPEEGGSAVITAYAGSSDSKVSASTKVVVGNYDPSRIVGRLTISARPINKTELVAHGMLTFTTYEDIDLSASFYHYYKPNEKYTSLMQDYADHPDKYLSDPALCNNNELNIDDRESYFDIITGAPGCEPQTISLKAGESITLSNYDFESSNLTTIAKSLNSSPFADEDDVKELLRQISLYQNEGEFDGTVAFDSFVSTLMKMYMLTNSTGRNPADGHTDGGIEINRELYNQFRRDDSQLPNNYYGIDITADELTELKSYLTNPDNNYYSLFNMNCSSGAVYMWNTALSDKPDINIKASLTGLATDPESLYIKLGLLRLKVNAEGEGGTNFYPTTLAYSDDIKDVIALINSIGEIEDTPECAAKLEAARKAYDALSDGDKKRIYNYAELTKAEAGYKDIIDDKTEPATDIPTEAQTEPVTEPVSDAPTEPVTDKPSDPSQPDDKNVKSITACKVSSVVPKTYNGKAQTQSIIVADGSKALQEGTDYAVTYVNNTNAGKATVVIMGKGAYDGFIKKTFTINKAKNTLKVKATAKKVKASKLKKKALKVKALKVTKAIGKKSYKITSSKSLKKKFKVNKTTGKITVKKGLKKGTYKIKVKVTAKGNANYKSMSKTVKVKITVK